LVFYFSRRARYIEGEMIQKEHTPPLKTKKTRGMFSRILGIVSPPDDRLLSLEQVSTLIKPRGERYAGIKPVPLSSIVGSEGRYHDFTKDFLPRGKHLRSRRLRIIQAMKKGAPLPPVQLYELGGVYFVRDGNHRVSAALELGMEFIDAEITSLATDIRLHEDMTMKELTEAVIGLEKKRFFDRTRLAKYKSDAVIEFSSPGRYDQAWQHIMGHKYFMNLDKKYEIPLKEAVISWYDNVYHPIAQIIESENILARFPGRTTADLYIWIVAFWDDLKKKYGNQYSSKKAALRYSEKFGKGFWQVMKERLARLFARKH
jgi:hypothetical protein